MDSLDVNTQEMKRMRRMLMVSREQLMVSSRRAGRA